MNGEASEKALFESVEREECKSVGGKSERTRYLRAAKATFRKHRRLNCTSTRPAG